MTFISSFCSSDEGRTCQVWGAPVPPAGAGEVKEAEKQLAAQNEDWASRVGKMAPLIAGLNPALNHYQLLPLSKLRQAGGISSGLRPDTRETWNCNSNLLIPTPGLDDGADPSNNILNNIYIRHRTGQESAETGISNYKEKPAALTDSKLLGFVTDNLKEIKRPECWLSVLVR